MKKIFLRVSFFAFTVSLLISSAYAKGKPQLVLGVMGDVHVRGSITNEVVPLHFSQEKMRKILMEFRRRNVDGVICTGDIADLGTDADYQALSKVWFDVFPDNRRLDGEKVEKLFVYGDHDVLKMWKNTPENKAKRAELWQRTWKEPYQRFVRKEVKGFVFLGAHFENDGYSGGEFAHWLTKEVSKLDREKPFFFAQHRHLTDTCFSPFGGDICGGGIVSTAILSTRPNAIAFSGHSHYSLTDDTAFWRGSFTSVATGAAAFNVGIRRGRENGDADSKEIKSMGVLRTGLDDLHPLMMQGMIVSVFETHVEFERFDFGFSEPLGTKWVVPRPFVAVDPKVDFLERKKLAAKDRLVFKQGKVTAKYVMGKNRKGEDEGQILVAFPTATAKNGNRVLDYEISISSIHKDWIRQRAVKRIHASDFYLPLGHEKEEEICLFSLAELGLTTRIVTRIDVKAIDSYGNVHTGVAGTVFLDVK